MNNFLFNTSIVLEALSFSFILIPIAIYKRSYKYLTGAMLCFLAITFDNFFVLLPDVIGARHFYWNFEGKTGEILWCIIIIYMLRWVTPAEAGLNVPKSRDMRLALAIGLIYTLFALVEWTITKHLPPKSILNYETFLFQFTLPGLAEEFFVRGVLLAILNSCLTRRWRVANINWGVGALLVTLLFIFEHLFTIHEGNHLLVFHFENLSFDLIFLSATLIFLREKSGCIWPGVLFHNIANGLPLLGAWLFLS